MVDAGIAVSRPKLSAPLDRIGPAPVKYVINTHWHRDHTDGNQWLHEADATVIAHENTLKHLSKTMRVDDWSYTFQPVPMGAAQHQMLHTIETASQTGAAQTLG